MKGSYEDRYGRGDYVLPLAYQNKSQFLADMNIYVFAEELNTDNQTREAGPVGGRLLLRWNHFDIIHIEISEWNIPENEGEQNTKCPAAPAA